METSANKMDPVNNRSLRLVDHAPRHAWLRAELGLHHGCIINNNTHRKQEVEKEEKVFDGGTPTAKSGRHGETCFAALPTSVKHKVPLGDVTN